VAKRPDRHARSLQPPPNRLVRKPCLGCDLTKRHILFVKASHLTQRHPGNRMAVTPQFYASLFKAGSQSPLIHLVPRSHLGN
jgi:hypothetical protein